MGVGYTWVGLGVCVCGGCGVCVCGCGCADNVEILFGLFGNHMFRLGRCLFGENVLSMGDGIIGRAHGRGWISRVISGRAPAPNQRQALSAHL